MADFTIDVSRSKTSRINLGIQGENIIEHIIFDISGWIEEFGEGVAYIYAQRKGDENPYPVALDMDLDAGTATWTITDADTAIKGKGKAQLVYVSDDEDSITDVDVYSSSSTYSVGDYCLYGTQLYKCKTTISTPEAWTAEHWDAVNEVKKTRVYATTVQASLVSTSSENPDAYETWLEVLGGYTARIVGAEDEIKAWVTAQINAIDFPVDDVQIDGTSVVSDGVAEIPKATQNQFGVVEVTAHGDPPGGYAEITDANGTIQLPFVTDTNGIVTPIRAKYLPEATTGGKGAMSAEDKAKLDGIESEAEANVQSDWNQSDNTADDFIKNKPAIVQKPTYKQVFTAPSTGDAWIYRIPYSEDYTFDDLLNFKVYFEREGSAPCASCCTDFTVAKNGDYWRYLIFFRAYSTTYCPAAGDTVVVENMFTDSDGTLFLTM